MSKDAWYSWAAAHLVDEGAPVPNAAAAVSPAHLIPVGEDARLIFGHNVSYDRARMAEEYSLRQSDLRFLDTMSLHIIVNGMTSDQRTLMQKFTGMNSDDPNFHARPKWTAASSMNNLRDVHQLYCGREHPPLEKEKRNVFVVGDLAEVRGDFQGLMRYCARDVAATSQVLKVVYPLFRQRCPHPATLGGMLEMSSCYLPISERWHHYVRQSDDLALELEEETARALGNQAKEACQMLRGGAYKDDLWLWNLDWSTRGLAFKKSVDAMGRVRYVPGGCYNL